MFVRSLPRDTAEADKIVALVIHLLRSKKLPVHRPLRRQEYCQKASISLADCRETWNRIKTGFGQK